MARADRSAHGLVPKGRFPERPDLRIHRNERVPLVVRRDARVGQADVFHPERTPRGGRSASNGEEVPEDHRTAWRAHDRHRREAGGQGSGACPGAFPRAWHRLPDGLQHQPRGGALDPQRGRQDGAQARRRGQVRHRDPRQRPHHRLGLHALLQPALRPPRARGARGDQRGHPRGGHRRAAGRRGRRHPGGDGVVRGGAGRQGVPGQGHPQPVRALGGALPHSLRQERALCQDRRPGELRCSTFEPGGGRARARRVS
mmetsp:Transcript_4964/g.15562  ORF Transcript_4964/g.15562 Transcript_4964/m.15562 type:complete len:257 (+) Transcript_4964:361-1131(+)